MTDSTTQLDTIVAAPAWRSSMAPRREGEHRFIVLEGLSAVGKSTIAPLLAEAVGAVYLDTLTPELGTARRYVDEQRSLAARLHFWMTANYVVSDVVRKTLRSGRDVVIESYFFRTLATHAAMGARHLPVIDWNEAVVPQTAIELVVAEDIRQLRLAARAQAGQHSYWSHVEERDVATTRRVYDSFGLSRVDTTSLTPDDVVAKIKRLMTMTGHSPQ